MSDALSEQFKQIKELLKGSSHILIASHQNPDPDAVASVLTFHHIFQKNNIATLPYLPDKPPQNLSFLPGFFEIKTEINSFQPDLLLCLDYGDFKRLRIPEDILRKENCPIVTIDHHLESDQRGAVKILAPEFSSTSEIIYYWLKHENIEINKDIATFLLTGIFSDSGGFCHVSTSAQTLNIVSELLSKGVSLSKIVRQTLDFSKPINLSRAWGQVLSRTRLDEKSGLAYSWLTPEDLQRFDLQLSDFDGIANLISSCSSLNLGLFLVKQEGGRVKCSLRSEPDGGMDVVKIARVFGGGGHAYAAGFTQEGTIQDILKKVINLIE